MYIFCPQPFSGNQKFYAIIDLAAAGRKEQRSGPPIGRQSAGFFSPDLRRRADCSQPSHTTKWVSELRSRHTLPYLLRRSPLDRKKGTCCYPTEKKKGQMPRPG